MSKLSVIITTFAVFLAACANPAVNKPAAPTDSSAAASTNRQPSKASGYLISPDNSQIEFNGSKQDRKFEGGFKVFDGVIDLTAGKPEDGRISINIDASSIYADDGNLSEYLKSANLFESAKYPKAAFVSTKIAPDPAKSAGNYMMTGDFELHGKKKSVTFPAKISLGETGFLVEGEFPVNLKDFEVAQTGKSDDSIQGEMVFKLNLKAVKQ